MYSFICGEKQRYRVQERGYWKVDTGWRDDLFILGELEIHPDSFSSILLQSSE